MISYILIDIEGTASSINFVHQTLFPYSKERLEDFVKQHANEEKVAQALKEVEKTLKDEDVKAETLQDLIRGLHSFIANDRKHHGLKVLQGMIWKEGFESGELKGHVYPEVKENLKSWKEKGLQMGIYSSGSAQAQKLLFGYSIVGDLTLYLSHFFDTSVGHKKESSSYARIAEELGFNPQNILFLSDVVAELEAASENCFQTCLLCREGKESAPEYAPKAMDFDEVSQVFFS